MAIIFGQQIILIPPSVFKSLTFIWVYKGVEKTFLIQNSAKMNRRWICSDVWMDILPSFDHAQLGLKMALLSDRFDVLVDKHFDGKTELTIWREIRIRKDKGPKTKLSVLIDGTFVEFPLPDHSLPNKIRFRFLQIDYIDHSVLTFLRSNKQIWDRSGTNLALDVHSYETEDDLRIWDVLASEIWQIFATNLRHFSFIDGDDLDNLRSRISPTFLTDSIQLNSIDSGFLLPDGIADDGPNVTVGQALAKWLHTPTTNGQPKRFCCNGYFGPLNLEWVDNFKETFRCATTSVSYTIQFYLHVGAMPTEQFELVHANYSGANLNNIRFDLLGGNDCIGPLLPPSVEEEEEADQSNGN